ncbi:hypothetical protein CALCODRAFT_500568 [Calocera cornea HHB12733]|uniref:Secreted protein n=1 Tax=Calocera cornea HHB12733 TaxID=1353952 RepID=A0A165E1G2_9BASI|nr:hypothetical protein CALCODRAFT_500568 [Calocera cornea HHB12733]
MSLLPHVLLPCASLRGVWVGTHHACTCGTNSMNLSDLHTRKRNGTKRNEQGTQPDAFSRRTFVADHSQRASPKYITISARAAVALCCMRLCTRETVLYCG